jgi:hypothetical protein
MGGGDTELSAPPLSKVWSGDSDSVSNEEVQKEVLAHQALGTMHLGIFPGAERCSTLAKSPLQAALQAGHSQGEDTAGFKCYPVLERPDPNNTGMHQKFHDWTTNWCQ